jgi:uncharacterized membrane protein
MKVESIIPIGLFILYWIIGYYVAKYMKRKAIEPWTYGIFFFVCTLWPIVMMFQFMNVLDTTIE